MKHHREDDIEAGFATIMVAILLFAFMACFKLAVDHAKHHRYSKLPPLDWIEPEPKVEVPISSNQDVSTTAETAPPTEQDHSGRIAAPGALPAKVRLESKHRHRPHHHTHKVVVQPPAPDAPVDFPEFMRQAPSHS